MAIFCFYKNQGETPLECLNRFRLEKPKYKDSTLSYAGRLDPMAEGLLLILEGEDNKNRKNFLGLDKQYYFEVLLGVETDTYDVLGMLQQQSANNSSLKPQASGFRPLTLKARSQRPEVEESRIRQIIENLVGQSTQTYPAYSSKTVNGKALFDWAKEGKLDEIEVPTNNISIFESEYLGIESINKHNLEESILKRVNLVKGDFRQKEIIEAWKDYFSKTNIESYQIIKARVKCSSGTYIRSLAHNIGKNLGCGAIAFKIVREAVGEYGLDPKM